jgi:hypothetical protein
MEIINKLIKSIEEGNILVTGIIIFVALIFNYKSIIEFLDSRKKVKISKLEEALKNENIKGLDRELLESELIKEQFKSTIGLDVEKEFREAIISTHKNTKGEVRFVHFQRGLPFLEYENNILKVTISKIEHVGFYINIVSSILLVFIGFVLFLYGVTNFSLDTLVPTFGMSFLSTVSGLFFLYESRHIISAKRLLKELNKQKGLDE